MFGSNSKGQLGLGEKQPFSHDLANLEIPHYHGKPKKIFAWNDASAFINEDGELYIWGLLTPTSESVQEESKTEIIINGKCNLL